MLGTSLNKSKKYIDSEIIASKILQQESEKQSDDFLRLFVGGGIKRKDLRSRGESKITTWDYQGKNIKHNENESNPNHYYFSRTNHINNKRIRQKRCGKLYTQSPEHRSKQKSSQEVKYFNKNSLSINLLNPNIQEFTLYESSQKFKKAKTRILKNYFIHDYSAKFKQKLRKATNKKVHTEVLGIISEQESTNHEKIQFNLQNLTHKFNDNRLSFYERSNKANPFRHNKRKSLNYIEKGSQETNKQQLKISQRHNAQVLRLIDESHVKFKQCLQFQKLKNLLNLQKI